MRKLILIAGGSTAIYACLAVLMGVLPGIEQSRVPAGPGVQPLSALQAEGRRFMAGCSYLPYAAGATVEAGQMFGRPSAPGDFAYQTPQLLGSERTGPTSPTSVYVSRARCGNTYTSTISRGGPRVVNHAGVRLALPGGR